MARTWTNAILDEAKRQGDPPADDLVKSLFDQNEVDELNKVFYHLTRKDQSGFDRLPDSVQQFITVQTTLPEWADPEKIALGESLFRQYCPWTIGMLFCASLPRCYTAADGVAVLGLTQELKIHARRRLPQTGQMVFDIMSKDGLTRNSKGLISAIKVRIMHAAVRKMILSDPHPGAGQMKGLGHVFNKVEWDESHGVPISQEAMCGTLLAFSYEVLFAMRKSGVYLSPKEVDAYLHCWNVAGDILGVRRDLMAHTYAEAEQLTNLLAERNVRSTKEGIVLTEVLMNYMDEMSKELMPLGKIIPFGKIPKLITRICIGGDDCKAVGLNYNPVELFAIPPLWLAMHGAGLVKMVVNQIHPLNHHLSDWLFGKMGELMKHMEDKDGFKIPTELDPA